MRGNKRGEIRVPAAEQHRRAPVIHLRQTKPAVLRRNFHTERAHCEEVVDVVLRNFAGAIDLIGIHVFAQIFLQTAEKLFARRAVLRALLRPWINPIEVVATDEKIAGETASLIKRIA